MKVVNDSSVIFVNFIIGTKNCLLLTVNSIIEYIYWEYNVIICMFLKTALQESLGLVFEMILMIFFFLRKPFATSWSGHELHEMKEY